MSKLLLFYGSVKRDLSVDAWFDRQAPALGGIAKRWFERMRAGGTDVYELMHDGAPTVCVEDAGFAYVNAFTSHINVGFFYGAMLNDPACLLEGTGKRMRHVKLRPDREVNALALDALITAAYQDIQSRLAAK